jgi:transcriptional regulator with XRE-family HTH domain
MSQADLDATQCKAARAALGLGVPELAAKAGVSPDTVLRLEKGETLHRRTGIAIHDALEEAGIEFLPDGGVRLTRPERE